MVLQELGRGALCEPARLLDEEEGRGQWLLLNLLCAWVGFLLCYRRALEPVTSQHCPLRCSEWGAWDREVWAPRPVGQGRVALQETLDYTWPCPQLHLDMLSCCTTRQLMLKVCGFVLFFKKGVPIVAQQKRIRLDSKRMWVQSLASPSRVGDRHELWYRWQMWLGSGVAVAAIALIRPVAWEFPIPRVQP